MSVGRRHRLRALAATGLAAATATGCVALAVPAAAAPATHHPSARATHKAARHPAHKAARHATHKAARPAGGDPIMTAGGTRTSSTTVEGLNNVEFSATNPADSCTTTGTTGADAMLGECRIPGTGTRSFTMGAVPPPSGWFSNPNLAISESNNTGTVESQPYTTLNNVNVTGENFRVPPPTSGATTNRLARGSLWAASKNNPSLRPACGLNVALLFDLSFSIGSDLPTLKSAGRGMVSALADTASNVALYTFGTHAPVNDTNNDNLSLRPASANETELNNHINGFTIQGSGAPGAAQFTNWDSGMWQMASGEGSPGGTRPHYDVAVVITDGDPTVYGPQGTGSTVSGIRTRFIDIENGIFSANALKAKDSRVIAVGVNASEPSRLNLRAISGPRAFGDVNNATTTTNPAEADYFPTTFAELGDVLKEIALANCPGTLTVQKRVITPSGDIENGGHGWTFTSSAPAARETTNVGGSVEFDTEGTTPTTVRDVTTDRPGFTPVPGMTSCVRTGTTTTVPRTVVQPNGFTVTPISGTGITCTFYNRQAATPTLKTAPKPSAEVGPPPPQTVHDTATLTGLQGATVPANSTVRYRVYQTGTPAANLAACKDDTAGTAGAPAGGPLPVTTGMVPNSANVTFPNAGTFYFRAFFTSGNTSVVQSAVSICEPVTVKPAMPEMRTDLSEPTGEVTVGTDVTDTATLTGVVASPAPPGTVTFAHFTDLAACEAALDHFVNTGTITGTHTVVGSPVPVTGTGMVPVTSDPTRFDSATTVYFAAFYSGDTNNARASAGCGDEQLVVTTAPSEITTVVAPSHTVGPPPQTVHDTAMVHPPAGVTVPTGSTVQYRVYRAGTPAANLAACKADTDGTGGDAVGGAETVEPTGAVPPSDDVTFPNAGTFFFRAFFTSADTSVLDSAVSICEPVTVKPATPGMRTDLSDPTGEVTVGTGVSDSATLSDTTTDAGGTVTFAHFSDPAVCEAALGDFVETGTISGDHTVVGSPVNVSGPGTVTSGVSTSFDTPTTVYFAAFYSGDRNNARAADGCRDESMTWTPKPPELATVTVNKDWVINGVTRRDPNQDPDFQAGLSLTPSPGEPVTWGEAASGYTVGDQIHIAETDVKIPPGCRIATSGDTGTHTLMQPANTFTVVNKVTCESRLTLAKELANGSSVPLTSWTLTARRAPGAPPVLSGTTGVTGPVEPGTHLLIAESMVRGFRQQVDPAVSSLAPGATGSWRCVAAAPSGGSGLEDFDGGTGLVTVQPGQHATCTAVNNQVLPQVPVTG